MIDAEYEELDQGAEGLGDELDLASTENLPWLESDEEDEDAGGFDMMRLIGFFAGLFALGAVIIGGVWWLTHRASNSEQVADGGVIEAPAGPIKTRPDNPGGKEFAGTGSVAPVVGEGGTRPAVVAEKPVTPVAPVTKPTATASAGATTPAPIAPAALTGVGVQLAAYGTRARAEQGWSDLSRRTDALAGVKYRVVEGKVDIGTVYRLQAVAGNRPEAEKLCAALKADGLDCQIK